MTDYQTIQTQKEEDGLLIITLSRPDVMNAFNARMMHEMVDALDHADADDTVRAIIVTGSGQRAFCAGADLSEGDKTLIMPNVRARRPSVRR